MRYGISKIVAGFDGFIEIDEAEYRRIKSARENLFEALFLEEKLDLVTANFYEYETDLLSIASQMMIFNDDDHFSMSRQRNLVSRRIVNLLTAGRMYLDQSVQHVANIYGRDSEILSRVKSEIVLQYDQSLGFRVMEALRNYVQHRGFPIHTLLFSYKRVGTDTEPQLLYRVIPIISVTELNEDGNFKKSVLKELDAIQNKNQVDARPLIREYIESIGKIHEKIREIIRPDLEEYERVLNDTIQKFKNEFGEQIPLAGLAIVIEQDDERWLETITIFKEFMERRRALEKRNLTFNNIHIAHASNEIRKDGA